MVVGLPYEFMDGGGDLTCSQGGVGCLWVLVGISCHGLMVGMVGMGMALSFGPHLSWLSIVCHPLSEVVLVHCCLVSFCTVKWPPGVGMEG